MNSAAVEFSAVLPDLPAPVSLETISTSPLTWPGTRPATFSSPTVTATPASPSSTRTVEFIKSWGATGAEPGKFNTPHSVAVDAKGNVYVADMGNQRIQVFDNDGTFKTEIKNVGAPRAICISPGAHQFLYSSNSNPTEDPFLNGEIYKMELDGTVLGRIGRAGKQLKEFGMVNEIDCRDPNTLYVAELMNWRVQKLTLHN